LELSTLKWRDGWLVFEKTVDDFTDEQIMSAMAAQRESLKCL
jgi:hypothetical protein